MVISDRQWQSIINNADELGWEFDRMGEGGQNAYNRLMATIESVERNK